MILPSDHPPSEVLLADAPRWHRELVRFRFLLAGVYFLGVGVLAAGVYFGDWLDPFAPDHNLKGLAIVSAVFFGMQALLLTGAPRFRRGRPTRRRLMAVSLTVGSLMAGMLTFGLVCAGISLFKLKVGWLTPLSLALSIGIPWAFWLIIFTLRYARCWSTGFDRMFRLLLTGTWVEMLVTIPVDIAVRRRTHCYCEEGSFFSLVIGVMMVFWTFGPGLVFLFLDLRHRRLYRAGFCTECGYDLRGLPQPRCPECGTPFARVETAGEHESARIGTNLHE